MGAIETKLFESSGSDGLTPVHHVEAVENGTFKAIGQLMVISILQDGRPPSFLNEWVYKYLCNPDLVDLVALSDDIVNPEDKHLVKEVITRL